MAKHPNFDDINEVKKLFEQLRVFCGDAHFVLSVSPTFDQDGEKESPAFNVSSVPEEQVVPMLEMMIKTIQIASELENTRVVEVPEDESSDQRILH